MERNRVFAVEGLDGTGKTTAAKAIARETDSQYYYCSDRNTLKGLRKKFEQAPDTARFLFYTFFALDTYFRAKEMKKVSDVFVDRTVISTIAYHKAIGLHQGWFNLVPKFMLDQINTMVYFTADEQTRSLLLARRAEVDGLPVTHSDAISLQLSDLIDAEYRKIIPERTLVVPQLSLVDPRASIDFVKDKLYGK